MTYASATFDVGLELPREWYTVDPSTDDLSAAIGRVVDERLATDPRLVPLRAGLVDSLVELGLDARTKNALLAAALIDPSEDRFSVAHLLFFLTSRDPAGPSGDHNGGPDHSRPPESVDEIAARLQQPRDGDIGPRYVKIVDLPAGRGVCVRFMAETDRDEQNRAFALECVQYWIPVAGTNEVMIGSFTTPMLARADEFAAMFEDVAGTLSIHVGQDDRGVS